ncbi:MAG TPA: hypothetical protein VES00_22125 [Burkholderiaceae bacterium]|nr:hypothetical protein [Burkholderiaceae bacterium]
MSPGVRVALRAGVTRQDLASAQGHIAAMCGVSMDEAIRKILAGAQAAEVDRIAIKIAADTSDGVHALLDVFDIDDARSHRPLLWELLREGTAR